MINKFLKLNLSIILILFLNLEWKSHHKPAEPQTSVNTKNKLHFHQPNRTCTHSTNTEFPLFIIQIIFTEYPSDASHCSELWGYTINKETKIHHWSLYLKGGWQIQTQNKCILQDKC